MMVERGDCRPVQITCGRCIGCMLQRSSEWATRCMHESRMHAANSFVTLTYDDSHVPRSLYYPHFQDFIRSLRKRSKRAIRFYMSGEYGSQTMRPHYHACLFGIDFTDDRVYYRKSPAGNRLYKSEFLDSVWGMGLCSIGELTHQSAGYCARYITKKLSDDEHRLDRIDPETGEVFKLTPEFSRMSLKPGIGATFFDKFHAEILDWDQVVVNGKTSKPPRFYLERARKNSQFQFQVDDIKYDREVAANEPERVRDRCPARLAVREVVTKARISNLNRVLE